MRVGLEGVLPLRTAPCGPLEPPSVCRAAWARAPWDSSWWPLGEAGSSSRVGRLATLAPVRRATESMSPLFLDSGGSGPQLLLLPSSSPGAERAPCGARRSEKSRTTPSGFSLCQAEVWHLRCCYWEAWIRGWWGRHPKVHRGGPELGQ